MQTMLSGFCAFDYGKDSLVGGDLEQFAVACSRWPFGWNHTKLSMQRVASLHDLHQHTSGRYFSRVIFGAGCQDWMSDSVCRWEAAT